MDFAMMRKKYMIFPCKYAIVGLKGLLGVAMVASIIACAPQDTTPPASSMLPPGALGPLHTLEFELAGVPVTIEVAISSREQQQGLMYRESMPENHGMLFVYPEPRYMSFWMLNTRIPLSIAFIREDGVISNIENMRPQTGPFPPVDRYVSTQRCLYALEMNQGWFERNGISAGDRIALPTQEIQRLMQQ